MRPISMNQMTLELQPRLAERFGSLTGDAAAVIEYLASKYMVSDEERKARALRTVEELSTKLQQALESLKA